MLPIHRFTKDIWRQRCYALICSVNKLIVYLSMILDTLFPNNLRIGGIAEFLFLFSGSHEYIVIRIQEFLINLHRQYIANRSTIKTADKNQAYNAIYGNNEPIIILDHKSFITT